MIRGESGTSFSPRCRRHSKYCLRYSQPSSQRKVKYGFFDLERVFLTPIEVGASPYSTDQHEVGRILDNLEVLVKYFMQGGCTFVMLKEVPYLILNNK